MAGRKLPYLLFMACLWAALPWLFLLGHGGASLDVLTVFRPVGDPDYLPLVSAMARGQWGEFVLAEYVGQGLQSFPLGSMIFHALFFALNATWGYVLGDITVALLMLGSILYFTRACRLSWALSWLAVAAVFASVPAGDIFEYMVRQRWSFPVLLWGDRFPRPYVTNVFFLLYAGTLLRVLSDGQCRSNLRRFALAGLLLSLLLQGDLHFALSCGLWGGLVVLAVWRRSGFSPALRGGLAMAATFLVASVPFLLSRALEHPDIPIRLGVFPMDRWPPLLEFGSQAGRILLVIALGLTLLWLPKKWPALRLEGWFGWTFLLVLLTLAMLPLSGVLLGKNVQIYHYHDRFKIAASWLQLLAALALLQAWSARWTISPPCARRLFLLLPLLIVGLRAAALELKQVQLPNRARDWVEVSEQLAHEPKGRVLATWDYELATWWLSYRDGYLHAPLAFPCIMPDAVIEQRLVEQARLFGMTDEAFEHHLRTFSTWHAVCKYQASRAHTFLPLEAYSEAERAAIARTSWSLWTDHWNLIIPRAEMDRLLDLLHHAPAITSRLDVVVAPAQAPMDGAQLSALGFTRHFTNGSFHVWRLTER